MIEKIEKNLALLDAYEALLTPKQKDVFMYAYQDDLSMSEIAENMNISKAAVFDLIKRTTAILNDYESKLKLVEKSQKRNELIKAFDDEKIDKNAFISELLKIE